MARQHPKSRCYEELSEFCVMLIASQPFMSDQPGVERNNPPLGLIKRATFFTYSVVSKSSCHVTTDCLFSQFTFTQCLNALLCTLWIRSRGSQGQMPNSLELRVTSKQRP